MRLLFCLGSMTKGGAERVVANLSNDFVNSNDVSIVVTPPDKSMYELNEKIQYFTLDNYGEKRGNIFYRTLKRIHRIRKIIKSEKPDIILSFLPEPTNRILIANLFNTKKIIVSVRNDPKVEYNTIIKKIVMKFLFLRANGFVFQTEEAKNFFSKRIQNKSVVIPNPINSEFICEPYNGNRNNHIVNVGRLTKQKNQELLIKAFHEFDKFYKQYELYIYGSGELEKELQKLTKELKISSKVHFEGDVNNLKERIYNSW